MYPSPANLARYTLFALLVAFPSLSQGQGVEEEVIEVEVVDGDQALSEEESTWRNAYEPLRDAIKASDLAETRRLLRVGPPPSVVNQLLEWTLQHASQTEEQEDPVETVEVLLAAGADPNAALPMAAYASLAETVRVLLEAGADPNSNEEHPALFATFYGAASGEGRSGHTEEVVSLLLEAGADLTARDEAGWTVPIVAAFLGDEDLLNAALDAGVGINVAVEASLPGSSSYNSMVTALDAAREGGHTELARRLLEAGAMEGREVEALFEALDRPDPGAGLALLRSGADPAATLDGLSVLMVAAYQGHTDVVAAALGAGVDVNAAAGARYDNATALDLARQKGHTEVERLLLEAGAQSSAGLPTEPEERGVLVDGPDEGQAGRQSGCNFEAHAEAKRDLGMENPERVAIFPWVHYVTAAQAATASIEPDRVTFPEQNNPWLDVVQEEDVLWAPLGTHEQTFLLRAIDREDLGEHIVFRTRAAAINEVFCHAE